MILGTLEGKKKKKNSLRVFHKKKGGGMTAESRLAFAGAPQRDVPGFVVVGEKKKGGRRRRG